MSRRRGDPTPLDRHELVRRANVHNVLRAIAEHAPVSRADVSAITGLSKPTVLSVVESLTEQELVRSSPLSSGAVGRAPLVYEPNPAARCVVGIDLGGSKVRAAVADLAGVVLAEDEEPTVREGSEALVDQLALLVRRLVKRSGLPWSKVAAVSLGTPGVVDRDGTVNLAANIPGLEQLRLGPQLGRRLRHRVVVENDVNIAALGEQAQGAARNCRTFVVLSVGTGVGLGLMIDGRLVSGAHGGAGEVAYLPIGVDPAAPEARRRGALEVAASGSGVQALLAAVLAEGVVAEATELGHESTARDVYAAADRGDLVAVVVVARHARILAEAILAVTAMIDPEVVVLAGGIGSNPLLHAPVREALDLIAPFPIRIETTPLGNRAGVIGAVAHARRRAWVAMYDRHPLAEVDGSETQFNSRHMEAPT